MKSLLRYMKGYRKECLLGPLLKLAEATLELLVPYVILAMIRNGIEGENRRYVVLAMLILIGMGFVGLLFSVAAQYFSAKAAVGFTALLSWRRAPRSRPRRYRPRRPSPHAPRPLRQESSRRR